MNYRDKEFKLKEKLNANLDSYKNSNFNLYNKNTNFFRNENSSNDKNILERASSEISRLFSIHKVNQKSSENFFYINKKFKNKNSNNYLSVIKYQLEKFKKIKRSDYSNKAKSNLYMLNVFEIEKTKN